MAGGQVAEVVVGQALAAAVVEVAVGFVAARLEGEGAEHFADIELDKARLDPGALKGDALHWDGKNHLLFGSIEAGHGDDRLRHPLGQKGIPAQAGGGAVLGVDNAVLVHQGEFVHPVQLFDLAQETPQGFLGLQIGAVQHCQGIFHISKVVFQLLRHHLGPASGQFLQIELAHPGHRLAGAGPGGSGHPNSGNQQNGGDDDAAAYGGGHSLPFLRFIDVLL